MDQPRLIDPQSNHFVKKDRLALQPIFSNQAWALFVLLLWVGGQAIPKHCWIWLADQSVPVLASFHSLPLLASLYCGALIAISFFEAPSKFKATQASRAALLDVGRLIFFRFSRMELLFSCYLSLVALIRMRLASQGDLALTELLLASPHLPLVLAINIFEGSVLQPSLDSRARAIIRDEKSLPSSPITHAIYVLLELVKVVLLTHFCFF